MILSIPEWDAKISVLNQIYSTMTREYLVIMEAIIGGFITTIGGIVALLMQKSIEQTYWIFLLVVALTAAVGIYLIALKWIRASYSKEVRYLIQYDLTGQV
jgi:hypothetical protein